ncbi:MAG: arylsulfatase [Planctomycetota bacterium]|nr:MAG: arylsulfatase [Planctomycetota bacterium]
MLHVAGIGPARLDRLPAAERPNIVLIMADDLGFADLGCYGSEIQTPHLDALARSGLRFNQFYNTAKCHSSRICLLTGLYMFQAGNTRMDRGVTIAEALRRAGYRTAMSGKWHLDGQPTDRGFERYFGHLSGSTNYFTGDSTFRLNGEKFDVPSQGFYTTDAITDYAIDFMQEFSGGDAPFFLYVAYNAPHYPLQVKEKDFAKYRDVYRVGWDAIRQARFDRQIASGVLPADTRLSPRPPEVPAWESLPPDRQHWEAERMAAFAGMVDCLDQNIGRLVEHLRSQGQLDNTIILFCSDNGACPFERTKGRQYRPWDPRSYWTYDVGWAHVGNTPFRKYKQNQHEGGISSPLIVSWSHLATPPGAVTDQPGHLIDLMATCLDLAGAEYPREHQGRPVEPLQGRSLVPIFQGRTREPHPWMYFQFSGNRALRRGDMKVVRAKDGPWELYDLSRDRTELDDLTDAMPDVAAELEDLWYWVAENVERAPAAMRKRIERESTERQSTTASPRTRPSKTND